MNNEFITLIAGFITSIVVSVFASIIMNLLLKQKRTIRNSGKPVVVYGQKAIEQIAKYCVGGTINTKDLLEHPSTKVKNAIIVTVLQHLILILLRPMNSIIL